MAQPTYDFYPGLLGATLYAGLPTPSGFDVPNELRMSSVSGTQTDYPYQFGRPFREGEIEDYPQVLIDGTPVTTQADVKTRHADGSVKFAVLSIVVPSLPTSETVLTFQNQASIVSTPETIANMLANYDFEATIGIAVDGTPITDSPVSARAMLTALSDAGLAAETAAGGVDARYWTQGPICTTVLLHDHTSKTWDVGTNATKAIRPMFIIQFWPTISKYRVRHLLECGDTEKYKDELNLDITFTTGLASPIERLNQANVNLFAATYQTRRWWGGTQIPTCNAKHGVAYYADCKVVENYDSTITMNATAVTAYGTAFAATSKALGANHLWTKAMPTTGGRQEISMMPKWDTVTLFDGSAHMHDLCEFMSETAGGWNFGAREGGASREIVPGINGQGRMLSKNSRPTLVWYDFNGAFHLAGDRYVIDGTISNTRDGWTVDNEHTPGAFWFSYLTTGDYIWHEKLLMLGGYSQFWVYGILGFSGNTNGVALTDLVMPAVFQRGWAWNFRNRARAGWAALDGSPEKTLCDKSVADDSACIAGLYDIPGMMVGNTIRDAWNTNHATAWGVTTPRPNALQIADRRVQFNNTQVVQPPPTNMNRGHANWQHAYSVNAAYHAVDLGYTYVTPLAHWHSHYLIQMALSGEPRHLGDFASPATTNAGGFYQSFATIYAEWDHNADGATPSEMPANSASGFGGSGAPNSAGLVYDGTGIFSCGAIAVANGAPNQAAAFEVVRPWLDNTVFLDHDPRQAIRPRT